MKATLKEIWKNRKQIAEGIKNNIFRQDHVEAIAEERMKSCKTCAFLDKEGNDCDVPGTQPCCGICGCSLALKLRSLSTSCPDNKPKWFALVTEEQEDQINYQINNQDQDGNSIYSEDS
jgi:hypothetical protein